MAFTREIWSFSRKGSLDKALQLPQRDSALGEMIKLIKKVQVLQVYLEEPLLHDGLG
jgi:hypothetical protein